MPDLNGTGREVDGEKTIGTAFDESLVRDSENRRRRPREFAPFAPAIGLPVPSTRTVPISDTGRLARLVRDLSTGAVALMSCPGSACPVTRRSARQRLPKPSS